MPCIVSRTLLSVFLSSLFVSAVWAEQDSVLAGHSYHGEAFNEGPRQRAYLMGGTGNVHFPVSVQNELAQKFFDQGIGQLHGFWYFEAERSFRQVLSLEPNCAMAYWGIAMANEENEKRAKQFIEKAVELKSHANEREKLWIDGLAEYLQSKEKDAKKRKRKYIQSIENIIHKHPHDVEAKAFLAVRIWKFRSDLPISSHQAVDALLDQVFEANPQHPAHHYRIHLWDDEKPDRALGSAASCGQAAPTIAHMWHMPGHTYSKLKRYADAVWQQEASSRADHAHMIRDRVMPDQIHNYAHNQEWMVRNLNHIGRYRDAISIAKNLIELPRHPNYNTLEKRGSAKYGRQRLFETLERFELWNELIGLSQTMYLGPTDNPDDQHLRLRMLGLAYAAIDNREKANEQIQALQKLKSEQEEKMAKAADEAVEKLKKKDEDPSKPVPEDKAKKAREDAQKPFQTRIEKIGEAVAEIEGHLLLKDDPKAAIEKFQSAKQMRKEQLARAHFAAGDTKKALTLAREAVDAGKNEVVPLATLVDLSFQAGKKKQAQERFAQLRRLSGHIDDLTSPVFERLKPVAEALQLPEDWRQEAVAATDVGERPKLEVIGPFRWSPSPAPPWTLIDSEGKPRSLSEYHGKPVVVIFYLGYGCLHCVEQLRAFAPKATEFEKAEISLVAVSTDSVADLKKTIEQSKEENFPIPLVSDEKLEVFKAYRAYDDFENQPLHGTYLIDGNGLVRWQDISFEPFTKPDFLLEEAKRLLALDVSSDISEATAAE